MDNKTPFENLKDEFEKLKTEEKFKFIADAVGATVKNFSETDLKDFVKKSEEKIRTSAETIFSFAQNFAQNFSQKPGTYSATAEEVKSKARAAKKPSRRPKKTKRRK